MKNFKDYISVNKEILGGQPVFKGTRVPIETLFNHLEKGVSLNEFLADLSSSLRLDSNLASVFSTFAGSVREA